MHNGDQPIYPDPIRGAEQSIFNQTPDAMPTGLTKREYFAAMAMQGMLSNELVPNVQDVEYAAGLAVKAADELLKQLES